MSDLHVLLPDFPSIAKYNSLLTGLETHRVSLSELLTLDAAEIGKRTRLPLLDLQRLCDEIREQLLKKSANPAPKLRIKRKPRAGNGEADGTSERPEEEPEEPSEAVPISANLPPPGLTGRISTLDPALDAALGGGFPAGTLSEIVGESGVGKTQLLLSLLVAVQLPPPRGLGRKALYIATEAPLATSRLTQIIENNPDSVSLRQYCSLQSIVTINIPDLEAQEHILTHQLPVQLSKAEKFGGPSGSFGLVILDSVAANFRPFFGGRATNNGNGSAARGGMGASSKDTESAGNGGAKGNTSLAARGLELQRLGVLLRGLAQKHNLAVVVANQVADRFSDGDGFDGGDGGGGLLSLSHQWGVGSAADTINSGIRQPKHELSVKKSRQEASNEAGPPSVDSGMHFAQESETPAPLQPHLPAALSVQHGQEPPTSHDIANENSLVLTQESPLAARSRKLQQLNQNGEAEPIAVAPEDMGDTKSTRGTTVTNEKVESSGARGTDASIKPASSHFTRPVAFVKNEASEAESMPFASSQYIPPSQFPPTAPALPVLQLDHQQRWFTGWGDSLGGGGGGPRNKTPSLGLVWAVQLGMRVALIKAPRIGRSRRHPGDSNYFPGPHDERHGEGDDEEEYNEETVAERHNMGAPRLRHSWRRWLKVVFAPHVASTGASARSASEIAAEIDAEIEAKAGGTATTAKRKSSPKTHRAVEFEITAGGLCAIE